MIVIGKGLLAHTLLPILGLGIYPNIIFPNMNLTRVIKGQRQLSKPKASRARGELSLNTTLITTLLNTPSKVLFLKLTPTPLFHTNPNSLTPLRPSPQPLPLSSPTNERK